MFLSTLIRLIPLPISILALGTLPLIMSLFLPYSNQIIVFWIDPVLTLDPNNEAQYPELSEHVKALPFKKYVGHVRSVSTTFV